MAFLTNIYFIIALTIGLIVATLYITYSTHDLGPSKHTVQSVNIDGADVAALWNTQTGHIEQLIFDLREREHRLEERLVQLKDTEDRIHNEKLELQRFQTELASMQKKLDETVLMIENEEVKNLRDMATKFSNIDPESLIKVFDVMDDIEVVKVLYFMEADAQSDIFTAMIDQAPEDLLPGMLPGPKRVAKLNEMLKFAVPPQSKPGGGLF